MKKLRHAALLAALACSLAACSQTAGKPEAGTGEGSGDSPKPVEKKKISVMVYDRNNLPQGEGTYEKNRWTEWINENGPKDVQVSFVPVPRGAVRDKLNTMFASGSAPDLILDFDPAIRNDLVTQKLVMPLDEIIEKHSVYYKDLIKKHPALAKLSAKEDGKNYMVGRIDGLDINHYVLIRNDWLKKLNLQVPKTPEELLAVAKAFADQDPDGNGKKDTYGIALSGTSENILTYMYQTTYPVLDKNLEYVNPWEQVKASNELKKKLYEAGAVDKDFLTDTTGKKAEQDFLAGKLGIWGGNFDVKKLTSLKTSVPTAEPVPMALPKTQFGQYAPELGSPMSPIGLINRDAKHPDAVMKFIDFISSPETGKTLYYGLEGVHWKAGENGCPQIIDEAKYKQEVSWNRDYFVLTSKYFDKCQKEKKPTMTELEKEFDQITEEARKLYLDVNSPPPYSVDKNVVPTLPQDLFVIKQNTETGIKDLWVKSIVTPGYSMDQALADSQSMWKKSGGDKVDQYYATWFKDNKQRLVKVTDWYTFK
ncbi:putative aldouronate transport system substrate-binding protein [Paenibacillus sp. UNCCL117]|uniref:extracellular solute-binding protein n=1 Tax=unclassified Paenibacillus TaxID=185978 RepID=UPI00088B6A04|nr:MULTISPECIES: extracellular solute-binding protein [unclassified Paenibacillus]SDE46246.1 putative aldouronate transport system substrate-binding protein [Paenibacillus sp. cl123]SFW65894.1 putative aldouronate transport system substrate-binding protein [Paenibacillus sp. UNCCL117]